MVRVTSKTSVWFLFLYCTLHSFYQLCLQRDLLKATSLWHSNATFEKATIMWRPYHHPQPPWHNVLIHLDFPRAQLFFQHWNWEEGDWGQSTGNYIVYFHENRDCLFADMAGACNILIRLFSFNFVNFLRQ